MPGEVVLRPVEDADLPRLLRLRWDREAAGDFQWFGFRMEDARAIERRWHEDGLVGPDRQCFLAVIAPEGDCAGWVGWRPLPFGNFNLGAALFPEFRGRGIGSAAQAQLVDYLFRTTTAHRLEAVTEVGNVAERRALEKIGFRCEGTHRGMGFRDGEWRDGVTYALLRDERG